jgi:hypothetical protein
MQGSQGHGSEKNEDDAQGLNADVSERGLAKEEAPTHPQSNEGEGVRAQAEEPQQAPGNTGAGKPYPIPVGCLRESEKALIIGMEGYEAKEDQQSEHQKKNGPDFVLFLLHKNL